MTTRAPESPAPPNAAAPPQTAVSVDTRPHYDPTERARRAAQQTRARRAANLARQLFPGPIGDGLAEELNAWAEYGWLIASRRAMALADDIEARHAAHVADRTYA